MKRRAFIGAAGTTAAGLIGGCTGRAAVKKEYGVLVDGTDKRMHYLAKMLKELCTDLGPRPIGSPAYEKSAEIVLREMSQSIKNSYLDSFKFERWVLKGEPLFAIGERKIESFPGHGTLGTPAEGISGVLRRIEDPGGIPYGVIDPSTGKLKAYVSLSQNEKANPLPYYNFGKELKSLPTFNIGRNDLHYLEDALESRTQIKLFADVEFIPDTPTSNVVGTIPGKSEDEIVILGHLDTVYCCPGANDNTATAIVMVMLAQSLSLKNPEKTITFVFTTGEEYNKLGAINYVQRRKKEDTLDRIKFVFNFDSFTWGPELIIHSGDEELSAMVKELDLKYNIMSKPGMGSADGFWLDARPFRETGARALSLTTGGSHTLEVWHRPSDIAANVPFQYAENNYKLFYDFFMAIQSL